jgi:hypothetical protein
LVQEEEREILRRQRREEQQDEEMKDKLEEHKNKVRVEVGRIQGTYYQK